MENPVNILKKFSNKTRYNFFERTPVALIKKK